MDEFLRTLDDGRVFVDYGPASMVITARRGEETLSELARSAFPRIRDHLAEIARELPRLRRYPGEADFSGLEGLPRVMAEAVLATGEPTLTPMAAVAGHHGRRGGGLAVCPGGRPGAGEQRGGHCPSAGPGRQVRMGILPDLNGAISQVVTIRAEDGIGGVCTSGLGGRSFTRGIAGL